MIVSNKFEFDNFNSKISKNQIIKSIYDELVNKNPKSIKIDNDFILFKGGLSIHANFRNFITVITKGKIEVKIENETIVISYYLNFLQLFFVSILISIIAGLCFGFELTLSEAKKFLFLWLFYFGVNFLIGLVGFHLFLKGTVLDVFQEKNFD